MPARGSTADVVAALRGVPAVTDEDGRAWPASEVALALCDCALTRAVVDRAGVVLDLGRSARAFRPQHWLALLASGQTTCAWPGCSMPLRHSELHHMRWWDRDAGRTSMANCAPLCRYHHQRVHDHDVTVTRRPDGVVEFRDRHGWPIEGGGGPDPQASRRPGEGRPAGAPPAQEKQTGPPSEREDHLDVPLGGRSGVRVQPALWPG